MPSDLFRTVTMSVTVMCVKCSGDIPEIMDVIVDKDSVSSPNQPIEHSLKAKCPKCLNEVIVDIVEE